MAYNLAFRGASMQLVTSGAHLIRRVNGPNGFRL